MRVLLLTPEFEASGGGIGTYYRSLAPLLRAAGVQLHVVEGSALQTTNGTCSHVSGGIEIETLSRENLERWWGRFRSMAAAPDLRRHLAAAWAMWEQANFGADADVVEVCDWGMLFIPPIVEATRPVVVQCHGSLGQIATHDPIAGEETQSALIQLLERALLAAAGNLQTSSEMNATFWRTETGRHVDLIRPAWTREPRELEHAVSNNGLVVGRLQRWKGPDVLAQALGLLGDRSPIVQWIGRDTAWGDRGLSTASHLARTYPGVWNKKLTHMSAIPSEEVRRHQAVALFNIVPSTWDVFNFTALETMASGRPTIVSRGAGVSELIVDGENGLLFDAGDPIALATAIDRALNLGPSRLKLLGLAGRESVLNALDPEDIVARRLSAYGAAIERFGASQPAPVTGWLGEICRPRSVPNNDDMAFLQQFPLRAVTGHVIRRALSKLFP